MKRIRIILASAFVSACVAGSWMYVRADESPVTQCGPGRGHDCHCPRMVQRRRQIEEDKCMAMMDPLDNAKCRAAIPTTCQMVAHPQLDPQEGETDKDICFKYCKYQGLCFCHDTRCDANGDPITPDKPIAPPKMQPLPKGKKK